jgi:hypothetical protein
MSTRLKTSAPLILLIVLCIWSGAGASEIVSIACPPDQSLPAATGAGAVASYPPPTAASACSVESVACDPPSGSLFSIGSTIVTCTATVPLGDVEYCDFTVHVEGAAEQTTDLIALVRSFHLKSAVENGLVVKLQAALDVLAAGDAATAASRLQDFISHVKAQMGKKNITVSQGNELLAAASQILAVLTTPGAGAAAANAAPIVALDPRPFVDSSFRATHNSYEGGSRRTIVEQLDAGVRFLELDFHDNDFAGQGDYRVGHDEPGDGVAHGNGNPDTDYLIDWLGVIQRWSRNHPQHAPITLALDVKDDLTDQNDAAHGNMAAMNDRLLAVFGTRLFRPDQLGAVWPTIDELRGRVIVVVSGNKGNRLLYLHDPGHHPGVTMDRCGRVVEVHDSGDGELWYWTGQLRKDGTITWHRHGQYDTGITPSVALLDDGTLIEVHQSEDNDGLWYHVGFLTIENDIRWSPSHQFGNGSGPTIRFDDGSNVEMTEIHRCGGTNCLSHGTLDLSDPLDPTVDWTDAEPTGLPLHDRAHINVGGRNVSVFTGSDAGFGSDTLLYATDLVSPGRIRYEQLAFVEYQKDDGSELLGDNPQFFAAPTGETTWAAQGRAEGKAVRLWDFDDEDHVGDPPVNFPATNVPFATWYVDYLTSLNAAE